MSPTETDVAKNDAQNDAKKDGVKREISVEIPAEEVTRETEVIIQKYQKMARLPGFRMGHVPASVIRQRFKEDLKSEVVEALVPRYFRKEAEKQGLIRCRSRASPTCTFTMASRCASRPSSRSCPKSSVEGYKELRAEHPEIVVKDEEVEEALDQRARAACHLHVGRRPSAGRRRLRPGFDGRQAQRG